MIGKPNRPNFHTLTPYIMVVDVEPVIEFLQHAFEATITFRTVGERGGYHVEMQIGNAMIMIGGGNNTVEEPITGAFFLYVDDVDAVYDSAIDAGATAMMPPEEGRFGEERGAGLTDPFGNMWFIGKYGPKSEHYEN